MARLLRILAGALIIVAVAGLGVTWILYPTVTKRFRYDVTLEVDGREVSGSTVWQMTSEKLFNPLGGSLPYKHNVRGEAIVVPISDDEVLFVLRRGLDSPTTRQHGAFLLTDCGFADLQSLRAFEGSCEVRRNRPEVVIARGDLTSSSLPEIDFQETGPIQTGRVRVVKHVVTTTNEPITTGIADRYPWIARLALPVPTTSSAAPGEGMVLLNKLYVQDFTTEIDDVAQ